MSPTLACLALAFVGVEYGYQPTSNGNFEFIVQISPETFQSLRPGYPIQVPVPRVVREAGLNLVTVTLGSGPPPRRLPTAMSMPAASAAPAAAPNVAARPITGSAVNPAVATAPLASNGPSLVTPDGQGPAQVAPPTGPPAMGQQPNTATRESMTGAADSGQPTASRIPDLARLNSTKDANAPIERPWLAMCMLVIALAATNSYVGWLFYDARQRYLGLLSRTFAAAK